MTRIFISYRRDDTAGETGRLRDHLVAHFGNDELFLDIDAIEPGTDFAQAIEKALERCQLFLVVIGRRWLSAGDTSAARRIDDPKDFVHIEVAAGLKRGIPVIPVLVQDTKMPSELELPAGIASLATRQAVSIDHDEFRADTERLIGAIEKQLGLPSSAKKRDPENRERRPLKTTAVVVGATLLLAAAVAYYRFPGSPSESPETRRQVDERLMVSGQQRGRRQYAEAWRTLEEAERVQTGNPRVQTALEDLAMDWLQNIRLREDERFTDVVPPLELVLDRGCLTAKPERCGDLLAHLGWASFLRYREGDHDQKPVETYEKALQLDPNNVYANTMLGHWLLWLRPIELDAAKEHFRAALKSGRSPEFLRGLQFAALDNAGEDEANFEMLRVANEMRLSQQTPEGATIYTLWQVYSRVLASYSRSIDDQATADLINAMPAEEHLATFHWLFDRAEFFERIDSLQRTYYAGLLEEAAGQRAQAIKTLSEVAKKLASEEISNGTVFDQTNKALQRLEQQR